jgi:hypothetical protein
MWYLDAASGDIRFLADVVANQEAGFADENTDNSVVQVNDIAVADYTFAGPGTATIALDRTDVKIWRMARSPRPGLEVHPSAGGAAAAAHPQLLA